VRSALVKTRPLAGVGEGGTPRDGSPAKPSTRVRPGDQVEALIADRTRIVEVVRPIESRVGLAAADCYVDHSPPPVVTEIDRDHGRPRGRGPASACGASSTPAPRRRP